MVKSGEPRTRKRARTSDMLGFVRTPGEFHTYPPEKASGSESQQARKPAGEKVRRSEEQAPASGSLTHSPAHLLHSETAKE